MQTIRRSNALISAAPSTYSVRQKLLSGSLGLAMTGPLTVTAALANAGATPTFVPTVSHTAMPSVVHHTTASTTLSSAQHATATTSTSSLHSLTGAWQSGSLSTVLHGITGVTPTAHDVSLTSSAALFKASSLAGFTSLTLDIGGKAEQFSLTSKLTGSELVAAEQVLSGSKQTLTINANGVATGGSFNLNSATLSALDGATGGAINTLAISSGVKVIDSVSVLQLAGSLINYGSILLGTSSTGASSSGGSQATDTINATNIYNAAGAHIASATTSSVLNSASIALNASNVFYNSGTVSSSGTLTITAPTIYNVTASSSSATALLSAAQNVNLNGGDVNNSGTIAALTGSINIINPTVEQALNINGSGGSFEATKGNINVESAGDVSSNININGGNYLSQQLNLNAGCGAVDVAAGSLTGVVNTTAGSSHITAATANLQLGANNVTGDPIFINTAGDVTIGSTFVATPGQDLAIVASRDIIGNGGTLNTSSTTGNGGAITLVAGANFTSPDTTTAILTNSSLVTKGSATGGYIDLSGITLSSTKTAPVLAVDSSSTDGKAGAITMVAYAGSQANSGSIVATETAAQTASNVAGATTIQATGTTGNGAVTLIGAGAQITAQNIDAGVISVIGGTPTITGGTNATPTITITDGTIANGSGTFTTTGTVANPFNNTNVNLTNIQANGAAVDISTLGKIASTNIDAAGAAVTLTYGTTSGSSAAPINLDANQISVNSPRAGASITLVDTPTTGSTVTLNTSTLSSTGILALTTTKSINIAGTVTGGTIDLTTVKSGDISGAATIAATTANLVAAGTINVNTAVNALSVNAGGTSVFVNELATTSKSLLLNASSVASGGSFFVTSAQQITVNGILTATDGDVIFDNINPTLTTTNPIGINVGAAINVGTTTGSITLSSLTGSILESKGAVLTAADVTLNAGGFAGTAAAPILTKTANLIVNAFSIDSIYVKDTGTTTFQVSGAGLFGSQNISVASAASNLTIGSLLFSDVLVTATNTAGVTKLSAGGSSIGDGTGDVVITSMGSLVQNGNGVVAGASATLTSTKGSVGASGAPILVSAPILTANATATGASVYASDNAVTTLNAGTAKVVYAVDAYALTVGGAISAPTINLSGTGGTIADLVIQANIGTSTTLVANLSAVGNLFQTNTAAVTTAKDVVLTTTGSGALIGFGSGTQSVVTKAATELTINAAANSVSYVTQNGTILLTGAGGSGADLNLALSASGGKLTTAALNYDTLSLTAPVSFTLPSTSTIVSDNLTITSPLISLTAGGTISVATSGSATFASTGALLIEGPASAIASMPKTLTFNAPTSITLGLATGGSDNPFPNIGSGTIDNLTINTNGLFKGAYTSFIMNSSDANVSVSVTASNIVNTGTAVATPFQIIANGTTSGDASLTLTGAQTVLLGSSNVTLKTQVEYQVEAAGKTSTSVAVASNGNLTLKDQDGIVSNGTNNAIALTSNRFLSVPFELFDTGHYNNVTLGAGAGRTFVIGANSTQVVDGVIGSVVAPNVTISDPTSITLSPTFNVTGGDLAFQTANLINYGSVVGVTGGGITSTTLSISNALAGVTTSTSTTTPGTYSGFNNLLLQSNVGSVNTTNLVSLLATTNPVFDSITISAATSVTLPTTLSNLAVTDGGTIYLRAGTISYAPSVKNPQDFLSLSANNGTVNLLLGSALTLGQARGQYDLEVGTNGSYVATSTGTLTVNEALSTNNATLNGVAIVVNADVNATNALTVHGTGVITESVKSILSGGTLTIGNGSNTVPAAALSISSGNVEVLSGALNLSNAFIGDVTLSQSFNPAGVKGLTFTNSQANSLTVNSLFTTDGSLNIINNKGELSVAAGSTLQTTTGSIILENNDLTSGIDIGKNATIYGSSLVGGQGYVEIIMGKIPLSTALLAGPQPNPNQPIATSSGNGKIFYTTTANPHSTITSNGLNTLNAKGRDIVFNGNGNSSSIVLEGGDSITGDPPVVSGASAAATPTISAASLTSASTSNAAISAASIAASTLSATSTNTGNSLLQGASNTSYIGTYSGLNNGDGGDASESVGGGAMKLTGGVRALHKSKTGSGLASESVSVSNGTVKYLDRGATLYAPLVDTEVKTGSGNIAIAAKSVVMVLSFDGGVAVYNLHDTKCGAVMMDCAGQKLSVAPGKNVVMTDRKVDYFEQINPIQMVSYRRMAGKELAGGLKCFQSEFSILSMLQSVQPLKQLVNASGGEERKLASAMLKTAAILTQIGSAIPYEYMTSAPLTALNPTSTDK